MITLLNTSILTNYGTFEYKPISLSDAVAMFNCPNCGTGEPCQVCGTGGKLLHIYRSAIGHQATAEILSSLLGVPVEVNRIEYKQETGNTALVFKLKARVAEGVILNRQEVEAIGYEFGVLTKI